ncbi:glycine cleavage system aminomethyltransferase GcvT [Acidiphilium sp. PA]|uniref:glycine cleavage system aminomethyltransferase GcvT n=1 Tax=Acidiphilium sp. PA TaxID=2871705 RepID=UPI002242D89C|nr:glycine cleavage system aminomethyltransferase GcvT [Acidiphilium sp. PA]MCW8308091.1 glycine cleavage system aminomethyltransferase GcvT [Acidiphilium sp. PA]
MADHEPQTVPLDAWHRAHGARMVDFAGYLMPVQYDGIITEHLHCRSSAALFDVSHMGQATLAGPAAAAALERVVTGDIAGLKPGRQRYTLLMNEAGGIVDDLMVANLGHHLLLVLNAGRKYADVAHITTHLPAGVTLTPAFDRALLALQGPQAAAVLAELIPATTAMRFMDAIETTALGTDLTITRSGYTGEDGFEIGMPAAHAADVATALLADPRVKPAGLGARDSLRLEAGLPLYGNDIDESRTPIAANLGFAIGKRRKMTWDFLGGAAVRAAHDNGAAERLVGLRAEGRAPVRAGATLHDAAGAAAGQITSGTFAPSLDAPIALGYVRADLATDGTALTATLRGRAIALHVTPLPFVPHRYAR